MASTSRRSLRERVLAAFGGKRPARHSCSSFNELQQGQRMDETGFPVPVASPNSSLQACTLPSTSRPMRLTAQGWEQVRLTDRANPQKSHSMGSFHHCTPNANMWPFSRFQETLVAHSELDRFPQMQIPTTESKNSSVRHKTKRTGLNISVPNASTEENFSQMDTLLCSEANRSSQMFDSSAGILDGNSESTTPLTSGQSSKDLVENVAEQSPAKKTSCAQRSVGMETDAVCDQDEDPDTDTRDLQLSHGAKTIIKTADAVIKIFDGSLSIKGRFKEIVVQMKEKKVLRKIAVDVATSTDSYLTQHKSSLPQPAAMSVPTDNYVDVGIATSLTESCVASEAPDVHMEDTPSVQSELRRLKYRLLNSDDDDESAKGFNKSGLPVATRCIDMIVPTVEDNVSGLHPAVVTVPGQSADELATSDVEVEPVSVSGQHTDCVDNTLGTACDNGDVLITNISCSDNERGKQELPKNDGERENPFVDVGSRDSDFPSDISRFIVCLPSCSLDSPKFVSSYGHVANVDSSGHSKEHLLETTNRQGSKHDNQGNVDRMCPGYSEHDNCDGTTDCENASQLIKEDQAPPGVSGAGSPPDQGSVAVVGDGKRAEGESHSEGLDLDDCEISAAADSSTIVDGCSPDSHPAESGTAGQCVRNEVVVADMKMASLEDGSGSSGGSPVDECGLVDVYKLTQQVNHQTGKLNKLFDKYRSRALKIERLQKYLEQLNKEKEEMCRLLEGVNKETAALRLEAAELRCTVSAVCDSSVTAIGKETEARRLEPTCYRRYTNIRTAADASNALAAVRCRIKALNELEVLVYRKQLMLNHILPSLHQDAAQHTKPALLSSKPLKSKKHEQTSHARGGRNNVVIEVLSDPNSWSELQTFTDSAVTISTALTTSHDGTASVGPAPGTDV